MNKVYLVEGHHFEWHRTIAVKSNKDDAVNLAKIEGHNEEWRCGVEVWEYTVDGPLDKGVKIYPDW
jgi:hypothetical protein